LKKYITKSRDGTQRLGERFAKNLQPGDCVAMMGDLGSGKTTFVKGIATGLGVKNSRYVNSPSFVILKEYNSPIPLYHFDVFRLGSSSELDAIGYEEYFYGDGVCVIEWADKVKELLPKRHIEITIETIGDRSRRISIKTKL